jgi:hypothetical protein
MYLEFYHLFILYLVFIYILFLYFNCVKWDKRGMILMNKIKKILLSVFAITVFLGGMITYPTTISAAENKNNELIWQDISELDSLSVEEAYSYDELMNKLVANGYSHQEAKQIMGEKPVSNYSKAKSQIKYGLFRMTVYSYRSGFKTYKLQARFSVGLEYINNSPSPTRIKYVQAPHIYTGDGAKCVFSGNIFYKLTAGNSFYYNFYGNIYKAGAINWSAGATIGLGKSASVTATISNGDGFVRNVSEAETYKSAGLRP